MRQHQTSEPPTTARDSEDSLQASLRKSHLLSVTAHVFVEGEPGSPVPGCEARIWSQAEWLTLRGAATGDSGVPSCSSGS